MARRAAKQSWSGSLIHQQAKLREWRLSQTPCQFHSHLQQRAPAHCPGENERLRSCYGYANDTWADRLRLPAIDRRPPSPCLRWLRRKSASPAPRRVRAACGAFGTMSPSASTGSLGSKREPEESEPPAQNTESERHPPRRPGGSAPANPIENDSYAFETLNSAYWSEMLLGSAYDSKYPHSGHRNVLTGTTSSALILSPVQKLFVGSPGHQLCELYPPSLKSG